MLSWRFLRYFCRIQHFSFNDLVAESSGRRASCDKSVRADWQLVFDELEKLLPQVYRCAQRLARDSHRAEDLVRDTVLRALQHVDDPPERDSLRPWLFRITANLWKDQQKKAAPNFTPLTSDFAATGPSEESQVDDREHLQQILSQMDSLPERQRAVLHLYAVEDMTAKQIAQVLGLTPQNVRVHLHYARTAMRNRIQDQVTS